MDSLPPDLIREIGNYFYSPFDLYSFASTCSHLRQTFLFSSSYDTVLKKKLHQGLVGTRLLEIQGKNKCLIGERGSGKTELLLHYILHYWRREKKKVIVCIRIDRVDGWRIQAKRILGKEMEFSYKKEDNTPILLVTSDAIPYYYHDESNLRNVSYNYARILTFSDYGLTIVDEETVIGNPCPEMETIFSQRPSRRLRGPQERVRKAPSVFLKKQNYSLPTPIYHESVFLSSHHPHYPSAEEIVKEIIKPYRKILIILPLYDSISRIKLERLEDAEDYIYDNEYGKTIDREDVLNTCQKKKVIMQFYNYDAINSEIHADCVIYYQHEDQIDLLVETEKSFLRASNPHSKVHIYTIEEHVEKEYAQSLLSLSIGWRLLSRSLGNIFTQILQRKISSGQRGFIRRIIENASKICKPDIQLEKMDPISFVAYCFPSFYKYISKCRKIPGFDLYQKRRESLMNKEYKNRSLYYI